jgi:trans-aconitate 2-methyltransferase
VPWDPELYLRFRKERERPFHDLLALVPSRPDLDVVDLGCGHGGPTRLLHEHLPGSRVTGIDPDPAMLAKARDTVAGVRFVEGRAEDLAGEWDVILSNAALHWVDDHERLVPALFARLRPGGRLAVQVPANHDAPAHRALEETARSEPFADFLDGWVRRTPVLPVERYLALLHAAEAVDLVGFEKVYPHVLPDADAVAEWTRGTTLVPYLERLPGADREPFVASFTRRVRDAFPGGPVFFPFRRVLFAATRP